MRSLRSSKNARMRKPLLFLFMMVLLVSLPVLFILGRKLSRASGKSPEDGKAAEKVYKHLLITQADLDTEGGAPTILDLSGSSGDILITEGGDYVLRGELDGSVRIAVGDDSVHLFLENVKITSKDGPAVCIEKANKAVITLPGGTESVLSDSPAYREGEPFKACVASVCDLTLNGSGTLLVNGYYKDGVRSKDVVKIIGGNIRIRSARDGIRGADGILVTGGSLFISSEKYGLRTTKYGTGGRGSLTVSGGDHTVLAEDCALVSERGDLYVSGCVIRSGPAKKAFKAGGRAEVQAECVR